LVEHVFSKNSVLQSLHTSLNSDAGLQHIHEVEYGQLGFIGLCFGNPCTECWVLGCFQKVA